MSLYYYHLASFLHVYRTTQRTHPAALLRRYREHALYLHQTDSRRMAIDTWIFQRFYAEAVDIRVATVRS